MGHPINGISEAQETHQETIWREMHFVSKAQHHAFNIRQSSFVLPSSILWETI